MLYPKEDRLSNTLMFACRTCQFSEPAASSCVFRNNLYNTVGETAGVTQDVGSDPTVGAAFNFCTCTLCGQELVCDFCEAPDAGGEEEPLDEEDGLEFDEDLAEGWREETSAAEESEITECEEDCLPESSREKL